MSDGDWPKLPIWPEDLPLIRELLTEEQYAELLRRRYCRTARCWTTDRCLAELKAPNAAGTLGADVSPL